MAKVYFKVLVNDLSEEIMDKSTSNNLYKVNRTVDGKHVMLAFESQNVPVELFQKQYTPLTGDEARIELQNSDWDAEVEHKINYNIKDSHPLSVEAFTFTATANTTTQHDYKITNNLLIKQASFISASASIGDSIKVEIVDAEGLLGQGVDYVVRTPIQKFYVQSTDKGNPLVANETLVGELIPQNLYIRIHYTSTAVLGDVDCYINLITYKKDS